MNPNSKRLRARQPNPKLNTRSDGTFTVTDNLSKRPNTARSAVHTTSYALGGNRRRGSTTEPSENCKRGKY